MILRLQTWNDLIDKYIAKGTDPRSTFEIELVAKIGPNFGPLYRTCEFPGCGKIEGRDIQRLQICSRCKMVGVEICLLASADCTLCLRVVGVLLLK